MNKTEELALEVEEIRVKLRFTVGGLNEGFGMFYAKELINRGYNKTVWHKVADGDLPKKGKNVLCIPSEYNPTIGCIAEVWGDKLWDIQDEYWDLDRIIAWTELPTYEE